MISAEYAAGFFDGEGCVSVNKQGTRNRNRGIRYQLMAVVSGVNSAPLEALKERWGGSLGQYKGSTPRARPGWRWVLGSKMAAKFLNDIMPYLLIKGPIARLGITLDDSHRIHRFYRRSPATQEVLDYRESIYQESRRLNKRGTEAYIIAPRQHTLTPPATFKEGRKLTDSQVAEIIRRLETGESQRSLALVFGVSKSTICLIHSGKRWKS